MSDALHVLSSILVTLAMLAGVVRGLPALDALAVHTLGEWTAHAKAISLKLDLLRTSLRIWSALLVGLPLLGYFLGITLLGILASVLLYSAPKTILIYLVNRRRCLLRDQLVSAVQGLSNTSRAGLTIQDGLREIAKETPHPLSTELAHIVSDFQHGQSLHDAILKAQQKLNLESFSLFSIAVRTTLERGGSLHSALDRIASSLREHQRVERKMGADTASGSRELMLLCMFPWIFLILMIPMQGLENVLASIRSLAGQVILLLVAGLVFIGAKWGAKILSLEDE